MRIEFEPTLAAAHARIAAVRPAAYARTRNALDGAVSGLSPYITHGFVTLPEVLAGVAARHPLDGAAQVRLRARLARLLPPCVEAPRRRHPAVAARGPAARRGLRPRAAGRHPLRRHRRAGGRPGGAHALRHRHAAQPRTHVAGELRGACAQGALARRRRLARRPTCSTATSPATTSAGSGWPARAAASPTCSTPTTWRATRRAPWHSPGSVIDTSYEALDRLARAAASGRARALRACPRHHGSTPLRLPSPNA